MKYSVKKGTKIEAEAVSADLKEKIHEHKASKKAIPAHLQEQAVYESVIAGITGRDMDEVRERAKKYEERKKSGSNAYALGRPA